MLAVRKSRTCPKIQSQLSSTATPGCAAASHHLAAKNTRSAQTDLRAPSSLASFRQRAKTVRSNHSDERGCRSVNKRSSTAPYQVFAYSFPESKLRAFLREK